MSTVVYKDGVMAADTRLTLGDEYQEGILKIGQTEHFLFGWAGRVGGMIPYYDWIKECEQRSLVPESWYDYAEANPVKEDWGTAMIADKDGKVWAISDSGLSVVRIPRGWDAIGSGAEYAIGALLSGKDAGEAVAVAMQVDTGTGGKVNTFTMGKSAIRPGTIWS